MNALPGGFDLRHARIFLVDDEPANLKLFSLMLKSGGYTDVVSVQDPVEVVDRYREGKPDLILLDINMPHVDGFAVMAALKLLADPMPAQIVVLTAQSGEDFLLRALEAGATDFLTKPVNKRELLARVRNILLAHLAHRFMRDEKKVLERMVEQRTKELDASRLDIVQRLGRAAEYRDNETGQHVLRMSHAAALLARKIGWPRERCQLLLNASPMHDVGKIGIPDGILLKPGPLTHDEREVMQTHSAIGGDILQGDGELLEMARDIALGHHEKWDGTGYPLGRAGFQIPEAARIVAITDVFDALTSRRPYKEPWSVERTLAFMQENAGRHFDPTFLAHFVEIIDEVLAIRDRFIEPVVCDAMQAVDSRH